MTDLTVVPSETLLLTAKIILRTPMFGVNTGVELLLIETPQGQFNMVHWTPRRPEACNTPAPMA